MPDRECFRGERCHRTIPAPARPPQAAEAVPSLCDARCVALRPFQALSIVLRAEIYYRQGPKHRQRIGRNHVVICATWVWPVERRQSSMREASVALMLILVLCNGAAAADTLLQYEHRVKRATEQIERIKKDKPYTGEAISYVKELLPKYEQVDYNGQIVTVDNTWLHTLLDSYEHGAPSAGNSAKLNEIEGRLRTLDDRLIEAEGPKANIQNIEGKSSELREILSRPEYRPKPEDPLTVFLRNIKNKIFEAVGRILRALAQTAVGAALGQGWIMMALIVVVLLAVLVVVVRMLMKMDFKRKKGATRRVLGEEIPANITSRDIAGSAMA